jgi:hypothetical protein
MRRQSLPILAGLLVLFAVPVRGDDVKDLKIIASFQEPKEGLLLGSLTLKGQKLTVVRSAEEMVAATNRSAAAKDEKVQKEIVGVVTKLLKVEGIDWGKQMVLVGVAESIDSLKADDKELKVTFVPWVERPMPALPQPPKVLVLTERFDGEVKFVPKK